MAYCSKCGTKVAAQADFCSSCGIDLSEFQPEDTFEARRIPLPAIKLPSIKAPSIDLSGINWKPIAIGAAILLVIGGLGYLGSSIMETGNVETERTPTSLEIVLEPKFDDLGSMNDGLAAASVGGKYGYVDKSGEIVIDPQYTFASPFQNEVAFVSTKNIPEMRGRGIATLNLEIGLINTSNDLLTDQKFELVQEFSEGLAAVRINRKWGYINTSGSIVVEPRFDDAKEFQNGYAVVVLGMGHGIIDAKGNEVVEPKFWRMYGFENGLARFSEGNSHTGFMNEQGEIALDFSWEDNGKSGLAVNTNFGDGLAAAQEFADNYFDLCGYVNKEGDWHLPAIYHVCGQFRNGMALVAEIPNYDQSSYRWDGADLQFWFINTNGELIFEQRFDNAKDRDTFWLVSNGEMEGAVLQDGTMIEPQYDDIQYMTHGLFAVLLGEKRGVVNEKNEYLLPPRFDQIGEYSEGVAPVSIDGKWGFIGE